MVLLNAISVMISPELMPAVASSAGSYRIMLLQVVVVEVPEYLYTGAYKVFAGLLVPVPICTVVCACSGEPDTNVTKNASVKNRNFFMVKHFGN